MAVDTPSFRIAHESLSERTAILGKVARALPDLDVGRRKARVAEALAFLQDEVVPHTLIDERVLYPEVNRRLRDPLATATMCYDHVAIRGMVDDLASAGGGIDELQELLYGLLALIHVHVWKEERLYLEMLDRPSWPT